MGPEPPLATLESVERYLIDHQLTLARKILAYERREQALANYRSVSVPQSRIIIHDVKIVRLQGRNVQLRITYDISLGSGLYSEEVHDTVLFDAEWVDGEMQIVGHAYLDSDSESDGRWRASGGHWEMEILIAGESVLIDATCAGIAPTRGEGVIRNGRIEASLGMFASDQILATGTLERLLVTSTDFTCLPAELAFWPVRSELSLNSAVQE
jgi:hypothetical protein